MESKTDFCVVLPSNSNMSSHPANQPGDYTVRLSRPVTLSGDWEVALLNIHYPHNWFDLREKATIHWIYSQNRVSILDSEISRFVKVEYNDYFKQCSLTIVHQNWDYPKDIRHTSLTVWPGNFMSVQDIGDRVGKLIEDGIRSSDLRKKPRILFQYDFESRAGTFHTNEGTLYVFTDSLYLANMMGMKPNLIVPAEIDAIAAIEIPQLYMLSGPGKSVFIKLDSIYVYSDIIENQHVGDVEAPLLGIVPVQKRNNEDKQFFTFNPPLYLPVNKSQFSEVKIMLRSARGEPLPFPQFSPSVVCSLRFRRRKSLY